MTIKTTIRNIYLVPLSRIFVLKIFCKLRSKCLWQGLFLIKSHLFSIFFSTPLDGCVCIYWKLVFEGHPILDAKATFKLQKPHCKNFWWKHIKNESCKCYLGNKEQNSTLLVVSQSHVHFGFEHPFFHMPDLVGK